MAEPKGKVQVVSNDRGVVINNAATYRISKVRCAEYLYTEFIKSILEASPQNGNNLQTAFANFIPHHHQQAKTGSRWSSSLMNDAFSDFPCAQSSTLTPDNQLRLDRIPSSPLQNSGLPHGD